MIYSMIIFFLHNVLQFYFSHLLLHQLNILNMASNQLINVRNIVADKLKKGPAILNVQSLDPDHKSNIESKEKVSNLKPKVTKGKNVTMVDQNLNDDVVNNEIISNTDNDVNDVIIDTKNLIDENDFIKDEEE
jgi:hypothetical protein